MQAVVIAPSTLLPDLGRSGAQAQDAILVSLGGGCGADDGSHKALKVIQTRELCVSVSMQVDVCKSVLQLHKFILFQFPRKGIQK